MDNALLIHALIYNDIALIKSMMTFFQVKTSEITHRFKRTYMSGLIMKVSYTFF